MSLKRRLQGIVRRALGIDFDPEEISFLRLHGAQVAADLATIAEGVQQMNVAHLAWHADRMDQFVAFRAVHVVSTELCRLALDRTGVLSPRDSFLRVNQDVDLTENVSAEDRETIRTMATAIMAAGMPIADSSAARH